MDDHVKHCEKRRRTVQNDNNNDNGVEDVDRLSALPDELLVAILSLLPINCAAITEFLSHRWHGLWTQVTALRFGKDYANLTNVPTLPLSDLLFLLKQLNSPEVRLIDIHVPCPSDIDVASYNNPEKLCPDLSLLKRIYSWDLHNLMPWVSQVFSRHVKEFKISLGEGFPLSEIQLPLPPCVFQTVSLVVLQVDRWFMQSGSCDEVIISLPNLKKLLVAFDDHQTKFVAKLIESCPLLEHLTLEGHCSKDDTIVQILALNLKWLDIHMIYEEDAQGVVVIHAPNLESFKMEDHSPSGYCFMTISKSLMRARICRCIGSGQSNYAFKELEFLKGMCRVRSLAIFGDILSGLHNIDNAILPTFNHLTRLAVCYLQTSWADLMCFLHCSPNLKVLRVSRLPVENEWKGLGRSEFDLIPACLSTKVKKVKIENIKGTEDELKAIRYLLSAGKVLHTLEIKVAAFEVEPRQVQLCKEYDFCEKLYKFPRSSSICKILFSGEYFNVSSTGIKVGTLDSRCIGQA